MTQRNFVRFATLSALAATCLFTATSVPAQQATPTPAPSGATVAAPTQAIRFAHADMEAVWTDLEARNAINKRVMDAGKYSINIRTIRETDAPLVHAKSIDIWIMEEGSATAVTGGELVDAKKRPNVDDLAGTSIKGGTEQPFLPGDILYVPAGVPHAFTKVKNFRAYLIRVDLQ